MKGHWSRVNLGKREGPLKDLHTTSVLSFPNANKKVYFNPYIYAKMTNNPYKSKKNPCQFFGHVTGVFHWKYMPRFSYASSQANDIGV